MELRNSGSMVATRKRAGIIEFKLMSIGRAHLSATSTDVILVDPGAASTAVRSLHGLFGALRGPVALCDPYFDAVTLEHLEATPATVPQRVLTSKVHDSGPLRRLVTAAQQGRTLEIRRSSAAVLHDRYLISDGSVLLLGASLNAFGKKQSIVVALGPDVRSAVSESFERLWSAADPWPPA
jgi:hypothetical protein